MAVVAVLVGALVAVASCSLRPAPRAAAGMAAPAFAALVARAGRLEIPRYLKFRELDPRDRLRVLRSPTLQRAGAGHPAHLRRDRTYLYAVSASGAVLIAEKAGFATNAECGHPNLTGAAPARISGELNYDRTRDVFVMDNDSGRYGFQPSRRPANLVAARALLSAAGVHDANGRPLRLALRWIKPWQSPKLRRWDRMRPILKGAPAGFDAKAWRRAFIAQMGYRYDEAGSARLDAKGDTTRVASAR